MAELSGLNMSFWSGFCGMVGHQADWLATLKPVSSDKLSHVLFAR